MQRDITLFGGPLHGKSGVLHKRDGKWDTELGIYDERAKKLAVYRAKTIRKYMFNGYIDVPMDEPVVEIVRKSDGSVSYRDPLGRDETNYSDLPTPTKGCSDVYGFVRELFMGGKVHLVG